MNSRRSRIVRSRASTAIAASGMAVTVGRLRPCGLLDWKFVLLSHNTIRGAAGATILNAELLASLGKLEPCRRQLRLTSLRMQSRRSGSL